MGHCFREPGHHSRAEHRLDRGGQCLRGQSLSVGAPCPGTLAVPPASFLEEDLARTDTGGLSEGVVPPASCGTPVLTPSPEPPPGTPGRAGSPSFSSQPSRSGLKKVCVRSFPSSSGILKGSFFMLSYRFWGEGGHREPDSRRVSPLSRHRHSLRLQRHVPAGPGTREDDGLCCSPQGQASRCPWRLGKGAACLCCSRANHPSSLSVASPPTT